MAMVKKLDQAEEEDSPQMHVDIPMEIITLSSTQEFRTVTNNRRPESYMLKKRNEKVDTITNCWQIHNEAYLLVAVTVGLQRFGHSARELLGPHKADNESEIVFG